MHASAHTHRFNSHFSNEPALAILLPSLFLNCASFWDRQAYAFHVILNIIPPGLLQMYPLSNSLNFLDPVIIILCSTCPNHLNLLFMIIKLTCSNANSSLSSSLFLLSFSLIPHIPHPSNHIHFSPM